MAECCHSGVGDHVARAHLPSARAVEFAESRKKASSGERAQFYCMLGLVGLFFLVELVVGSLTGSLALVSDALHMLSDFLALGVGFLAVWYHGKPKTDKLTFGFVRLEVVGALSNGVFMLAVVLFIVLEALTRIFFEGPESADNLRARWMEVLIVGAVGLGINIIGLFLFGGHHGHSHGGDAHGHAHGHGHGHGDEDLEVDSEHKHEDHAHEEKDYDNAKTKDKKHNHSNMNIQGVFLHVLGDALGSLAVILTALLVHFVDVEWIYLVDPVCSLLIAMILLFGTVPIVKRSLKILLQNAPEQVHIKELHFQLLRVEGVADIHEFHVWQLSSMINICSLHVVAKRAAEDVLHDIKLIMHEYGIHSSTVQIEPLCEKSPADKDACHDPICSEDCLEKLCCPVQEEASLLRKGKALD